MVTSQPVSDGDIVANVVHEMETEVEQVDSDDDNEGTEADDTDYIGSTSQFLYIVNHRGLLCNEINSHLRSYNSYKHLNRTLYINRSKPARNKHH